MRDDELKRKQTMNVPTAGAPSLGMTAPGTPVLIMTRPEIERQLKRPDSLLSKMRDTAILAFFLQKEWILGLYEMAKNKNSLEELRKLYRKLEEHYRHHHRHHPQREDSDEKKLSDGLSKIEGIKLSYETWAVLLDKFYSLIDERNDILTEAHRLRETHRAEIQEALETSVIEELKLIDPSLHEELQDGLWEKIIEQVIKANQNQLDDPNHSLEPDPLKADLDSCATLQNALDKKHPNILPAGRAFPVEVRQEEEIRAMRLGNFMLQPVQVYMQLKNINLNDPKEGLPKIERFQKALEQCPSIVKANKAYQQQLQPIMERLQTNQNNMADLAVEGKQQYKVGTRTQLTMTQLLFSGHKLNKKKVEEEWVIEEKPSKTADQPSSSVGRLPTLSSYKRN